MMSIFGDILNPYKGLSYRSGLGPNEPGSFGLIIFFNNIIKLLIVAAGIYAFIQILMAGFLFISAGGDPKQISSAWNKIWQAGLGLVIIASSFVLAAIFGWVILGDPSAILYPKLYGPGTN